MNKHRLMRFMGAILLENDVDASQELTTECPHSDTVGFALSHILDQGSVQIGVLAVSTSSSHPEGFPYTGRALLGDRMLCAPEFSRHCPSCLLKELSLSRTQPTGEAHLATWAIFFKPRAMNTLLVSTRLKRSGRNQVVSAYDH